MSGDGLVPPSAKKIAAACVLVQFRQKLSVCKLLGAAGLRKALQKRGGFDSLHPLQSYQKHVTTITYLDRHLPTVLKKPLAVVFGTRFEFSRTQQQRPAAETASGAGYVKNK
jgi:hypothetical protein